MAISTQAAKQKGRKLQQLVRDGLLKIFPSLTDQDIRSVSMGASGEDVLLSTAARKKIPYSIECKARNSMSIYSMYEQAVANSKTYEPLLVIRADRKKALAVIDFDHFLKLIQERK